MTWRIAALLWASALSLRAVRRARDRATGRGYAAGLVDGIIVGAEASQ